MCLSHPLSKSVIRCILMKKTHRAEQASSTFSPAKVLRHLAGAAGVLLLCLVCAFPAAASAGAVVVDTASLSTEGGVTTIPVYLTGAEDILSFAAEVSNTQPGVTVTISETLQSERGMTIANSNPENPSQRVAWISTAGVTADKMLMFAIEITVTDPTVTSVPLEISLTEIASDEKGMLPVSNYQVSSASFMLSDTVSGTVSGGDGSVPTPTTPVPETPTVNPTVPENPSPVLPEAPDVLETPEDVPETPSESIPLPDEIETPASPATPQSPGFASIPVLLSLASAMILYRREG